MASVDTATRTYVVEASHDISEATFQSCLSTTHALRALIVHTDTIMRRWYRCEETELRPYLSRLSHD